MVVDQEFVFKITGSSYQTLLEYNQMSMRIRLSGEQWPPLLLYKFVMNSKPLTEDTSFINSSTKTAMKNSKSIK